MNQRERKETNQGDVDLASGKVEFLDEEVERGHVEGVLEVAEVLANHLLADALPRYEELGYGPRRVLQEALHRWTIAVC